MDVDDEDPVEATEDTKLIPIKVDGKEEHWTLDQLKQSAAGQAAINKRFQEAAEVRKQSRTATSRIATAAGSKLSSCISKLHKVVCKLQPRHHASYSKVTQ